MNLHDILNAPLWQHGERELVCLARIDETRDGDTVTAASFEFQTAGRPSRFCYLPGQFLLLAVPVAGQTLQRAYSLSSTPTRPHSLTVTVKRVAGGRVSNHLLDHLQPGMTLAAQPPAGSFHLPAGALPASVLLLSAGSGITPMLAMARALLDLRAPTRIHFLHSARSRADLIAGDALLALAAAHDHFRLDLVLEDPSGDLPCHAGRLDAALLGQLVPRLDGQAIYLCGPAAYMAGVEQLLGERGVSPAHLNKESFGGPAPAAEPAPAADTGAGYRLSVPAFGKEATIAPGQSLLEALEREGLPIIGACRAGVCGSCKCKVIEGSVTSSSQMALTAEQIADGYVLACASQADSDLAVALG